MGLHGFFCGVLESPDRVLYVLWVCCVALSCGFLLRADPFFLAMQPLWVYITASYLLIHSDLGGPGIKFGVVAYGKGSCVLGIHWP